MRASDLLAAAERIGMTVAVDGEAVRVRYRGPRPVVLLEELRAHKAEIVALLVPYAGCVRCGASEGRLVGTYWSGWTQALCSPCVKPVVADFDEHDSWPPAPWDPGEVPNPTQEQR